ncbi:MAG: lipoprotein insertase outer membrane protein LolB, partial [Gammaproteobacteria bacterium]
MKPLLGGLVLALLLAGCAGRPVLDTDRATPAAMPPVTEYPVWRLRGRTSLVRGEQGWHAGMHWSEADGHYRLNLSGPLGQGAVQIDGEADGIIRLQTADGVEYTAQDVDTLVEAVTGWRFPVSGIRYWVRGVPAPGPFVRADRDASGRLEHLLQDGWDIRYSRYRTVAGRDWPT